MKGRKEDGVSLILVNLHVFFLREACEAALEQKYFLDQSELEGFVDEAEIAHRKQLKSLRTVFEKVAEADAPSEVSMLVTTFISLFSYNLLGITFAI